MAQQEKHTPGHGEMIAENAISVIRRMLEAHDVPSAAFIDDHVGNAIFQRNEARAECDRLREINAELVGALEYMIDKRGIKCMHAYPPPVECCAKCKADAALAKAKENGEGDG